MFYFSLSSAKEEALPHIQKGWDNRETVGRYNMMLGLCGCEDTCQEPMQS